MIEYIETQANDGTPIRIEVEPSSKTTAGFARQAGSGAASEDQQAYQQMLTTIQSCANGVIGTIQNLEAQPDSASIDFAIKFDAQSGAMIAKSINEGQFKVSLSWKQAEPPGDED